MPDFGVEPRWASRLICFLLTPGDSRPAFAEEIADFLLSRGRAKVRVLTEMSLFFLSQINTFNATSSLNKKYNKFMYWIHGQIISCMIIWEPLQRFLFIWNNFFSMFLISAILPLELSMNGCRKAKVSCTKKREFNSKIRIFLKDFLALLKSLHVKNFIEKKNFLIWYETAGSKRVS